MAFFQMPSLGDLEADVPYISPDIWLAYQQMAAGATQERVEMKPPDGARKYRIKRGDQVVEAYSRNTSAGWAFETLDQALAKALVEEIELACEWFWKRPTPDYFGCPEIEGVTDEEIRVRIVRVNQGENTREARRTKKQMFDLEQLPFDRQRALIEHCERIKAEHGFEWVDA